MSDNDVVIVGATRTPLGNLCGAFVSLKAHDLGATVIKSVVSQAKLEPQDITEVILGQSLQAGQGQNPARQASIQAGLPLATPAYSLNMLCGSGLKAVALAYQSVLCEPEGIIVAGGQESMTQAPHVQCIRTGHKLGNVQLVDSMLNDGLTDVFHNVHMGVTAERVAEKYNVSRQEQDALAVESQRRTQDAIQRGFFAKEITPVSVTTRGQTVLVDQDEFPKPATTLESLAKLKTAFQPNGTVTPGNASGINDGAAAVVVTSRAVAKAKNLTPRARIVGVAHAGFEPLVMGIGPVPAVQNLLKKIGWTIDSVDFFELNEAFAAQSCAVLNELGIDKNKANVNGGAIALGHPIGASGARVLVTLINVLEERNAKRGIASLCIGGGMGIAMAIERP